MPLDTVLVAMTLLLGTIAFAVGVKKLETSTATKTLLLVSEIALMVVGYVQLGMLGLILAIVVSAAGLMIYSVRLFAIWEDHLTYAATQARVELASMKNLSKELRGTDKAFALLGLVGTAELISHLSQRNRDIDEIRKMARPVALLWVVHRGDMGTLVGKFDQLMRLYGHSATNAMTLADQISAATRISAATFDEVIDAMIAFAIDSGSVDDAAA